MDLLKEFQDYIKKENLFQFRDRLLLAVSGGVDSIALCELCKQAGYDFAIAHCNFQLRGSESDEDEEFVKALGGKYAVEVFVKRFDTEKYAEENKSGIQAAAREIRYGWFAELIARPAARPISYLLTAHHANDNVETMLMNFFKGTGIAGLQGILPKQKLLSIPGVIRPLLFAKKEEIMLFATQNELEYREDASNITNKYTRNYFRNELIPALQKVYPAAVENLIENIGRFKEINILYEQSIAAEKKKLTVKRGNEIHIPVFKLLKVAALQTVVYELIKDYGFSSQQSAGVIKLLYASSGKYIESSSYRVLRNRAWLIISPFNDAEAQHYLIKETDRQLGFTGGKLYMEKIDDLQPVSTDPNIIMLDNAKVQFPLLLRKWKQGDYFYPLGMQKKKKLSRFFVDQKLSLFEKENSWVIESNKKIIWIIGRRIDDRFKITANTKQVLRLTLSPAK